MRVVNKYRERGTVNIMRPGPFGNPYKIGRDGSREQVIAKFHTYAMNNKRLLNLIYDLPHDAILECCCKPNACHGDIIVELWVAMHK